MEGVLSYQPAAYNPLDTRNLCRSVAGALMDTQPLPLASVEAFLGAGIYALFYVGSHPAYQRLRVAHQAAPFSQPIYVGKAVPGGARKGSAHLAGKSARPLFARLSEHARSLSRIQNLSIEDFWCRYLPVEVHSRGEDDVIPVTSPKDGTRYLSPIAYWSEEDVWEYLGVCKAGAIPAYSDFEDMFRIYAHSAGSSCAVVGADVTASNKNNRACGARTGCATCTAIGRDKSLEAMIDYDPRYAYARGLNLLQRFLVNTQYDLNRRNWVCHSVDEQGHVKFEPDTYHPKMLESLLRYALTLDVEEFRQAKALGLSAPRFQLIPLEALFAIDPR